MIFQLKIKNIFFILLGSAIFSFGVVNINIENNLAEGGFTGITLIIYALIGLKPSITNIILNIPLFFVGYKLLGKITFLYSIIGTVSVSIFLAIFENNPFPIALQNDMALAALFAGVFIGAGLGIIFRYGGTTGGVDIIARLVHKYIGWGMGKTMFLFDAVVITLSLSYLTYQQAMYTLVVVFVGARVIDFMQEGAYSARGAIIISDHCGPIAEKISEQLGRGATLLNGTGTYTKQPRDVLYCVVSRNEVVRLKNVINAVDPHAFVSVTEVHDVLGEGFTLDENKNPIIH
ncbi:MAG: YitT family protein [Bacillaceae bacterium]